MNKTVQAFTALALLAVMSASGVYLEVYDGATALLVFGAVAGYAVARWLRRAAS